MVDATMSQATEVLIECGVEGLTLRKGDGLRVDLVTGEVFVFRDDDAPALLRGRIPAVLHWSFGQQVTGVPCETGKHCERQARHLGACIAGDCNPPKAPRDVQAALGVDERFAAAHYQEGRDLLPDGASPSQRKPADPYGY